MTNVIQPIPTPTVPEYFDYRAVAQDARLTPEHLRSVQRIFEADYPTDLMLRELHILRACNAIRSGTCSIEDVLRKSGGLAA